MTDEERTEAVEEFNEGVRRETKHQKCSMVLRKGTRSKTVPRKGDIVTVHIPESSLGHPADYEMVVEFVRWDKFGT
jgi:hypothetical protein